MALGNNTLYISKEVDSVSPNNEEVDLIQPLEGQSVLLLALDGQASYDPNAAVRLVWRWDHATESEIVIWTIKGGAVKQLNQLIHKDTGFRSLPDTKPDGVRKLALCLTNRMASGKIFMSADMLIRIW